MHPKQSRLDKQLPPRVLYTRAWTRLRSLCTLKPPLPQQEALSRTSTIHCSGFAGYSVLTCAPWPTQLNLPLLKLNQSAPLLSHMVQRCYKGFLCTCMLLGVRSSSVKETRASRKLPPPAWLCSPGTRGMRQTATAVRGTAERGSFRGAHPSYRADSRKYAESTCRPPCARPGPEHRPKSKRFRIRSAARQPLRGPARCSAARHG